MSTFIDTAENYQYFYQPLSLMRREKFKRIVSQIEGRDVLDLGCGQAGHYWAMGYAHKVDSITYFDAVEENIAEQLSAIETLSPDYIGHNLMETVEHLYEQGYIPADYSVTDIATNIITKMRNAQVFDFVKDNVEDTFDTIMAMESVEIADTYEDFVATLKNVKTMLRPNGLFLGVTLPYDELLPTTQEQIDIRREGILNPKEEMTRQAFADAGWNLERLESFETLQPNYSTAWCFYARH